MLGVFIILGCGHGWNTFLLQQIKCLLQQFKALISSLLIKQLYRVFLYLLYSFDKHQFLRELLIQCEIDV